MMPPTTDDWPEIAALFSRTVELSSAERRAVLDRDCRDPGFRREVERLLAAHDAAETDQFLAELDTERAAALLAAAPGEDEPPDAIGPYRVVRRLGGGGMGVVYLAHDPRLDRPVAVKLLRQRVVRGLAGHRLIDEARAASDLDHPNTVPLYEVGETGDGRVYLAMGYAGSDTLADRLRSGPLSPRAAAETARQIADVLAAAHRAGIVHRDVKPSNILVPAAGRPRLVDFGIAAVAGRDPAAGAGPGTLPYMSPEQTRGEAVDHRTDLWSLGAVLYEMLTGQRPFHAADRDGLVRAIREAEPSPIPSLRPDVPDGLVRLVERCLARAPADRPPGAEAVVRELDEILRLEDRAGEAPPGGPGTSWRRQVAAAVVVVALAAAVMLRSGAPDSDAPAATVAVLPFSPVGSDTALERLGRELVVTLSSTLDGAGGIRVVEPVTVLGRVPLGGAADLDGATAAALGLGAGRVVHGRLSRSGAGVRLDAAVHEAATRRLVARASATAAADDIGALTDSAALGLLRAGLGVEGARIPGLAAVTTSSVPALRAYLEGELAIAGARFRAAPLAFARAIEADSSFWLAYWRYMYARDYHGLAVDSVIQAAVFEHRSALPEPDRLMVEARMTPGTSARLAVLESATARFPTYWPAWFALGDQLLHHGVFVGRPLEEARSALRRVVELNPRFVPGWSHLLWIAVHRRDTAASGRALGRLEALRVDSLMRDEWDLSTLDFYRYLHDLARSGGRPSEAHTAFGANLLATYTGPLDPERLAVSLGNYGFFRAQIAMARRVRSLDPAPAVAAAQDWAEGVSWAGRGDWDSAFAALRRYSRRGAAPSSALWAYGLAATGSWLGALDPDSAEALRPEAARAASAPGSRAELAWLDGVIACARGDGRGLGAARDRLAGSSAPGAPSLAGSLDALATALAGRPHEAGRRLAALETANADSAWAFVLGSRHPWATAVNRLSAAHWLLEAGDTAAALPLLRLHETDLPGRLQPLPVAQLVLGTRALPRLADVLERRGQPGEAARIKAIFAERADRAGPDTGLRPCAAATPD